MARCRVGRPRRRGADWRYTPGGGPGPDGASRGRPCWRSWGRSPGSLASHWRVSPVGQAHAGVRGWGKDSGAPMVAAPHTSSTTGTTGVAQRLRMQEFATSHRPRCPFGHPLAHAALARQYGTPRRGTGGAGRCGAGGRTSVTRARAEGRHCQLHGTLLIDPFLVSKLGRATHGESTGGVKEENDADFFITAQIDSFLQ